MAMLLEWAAILMRRLWEVRTSGARRGGGATKRPSGGGGARTGSGKRWMRGCRGGRGKAVGGMAGVWGRR
jgi:hypothetical protein